MKEKDSYFEDLSVALALGIISREEAIERLSESSLEIEVLRFSQEEFDNFLHLLGLRMVDGVSFVWRVFNRAVIVINAGRVPSDLMSFTEIHERVEIQAEWNKVGPAEAEEMAIRSEYEAARKSGMLDRLHEFARRVLDRDDPEARAHGVTEISDKERWEIRQRIFADLSA